MPSDAPSAGSTDAFDEGLLSPVTVGLDGAVSDTAVLGALVAAEVALVRAHVAVGAAPPAVAAAVEAALGWVGPGEPCRGHGVALGPLATAAVAGGNPVIPLVGALRDRVPASARPWVHRGATSQDVLDSALTLVAARASALVVDALRRTEDALAVFAGAHRDEVAAGRTLTQHAVPTTVGLRAAVWLAGVRRGRARLEAARAALPAQLGGAAGTLASFVELLGAEGARDLTARFAAELCLAVPEAPWHTTRWPVTELGDALVQAVDAVGKLASDVATLSRTEIGELAEGIGGGSSAMPQKRNPAASVLIRSAALRAPHLGATLHTAAALAVDERPDGAWHAEWPVLRELLRLALGASAHAARLVEGLRVDPAAVARNLAATGGGIVAERLSSVLGPLIGRERLAVLVAGASPATPLDALVRALPEAAGLDVDALLDPARYVGLAGALVDRAVAADGADGGRPRPAPDPEEPA